MIAGKTFTLGRPYEDLLEPEKKEFTRACGFFGKLFGTDVRSIPYLLQNGFAQSLQDSVAQPKAKCRAELKLAKGMPDTAEVIAVMHGSATKRLDKIIAGELTASEGGGRDAMRACARSIITEKLNKLNAKLSKEDFDARVEELLATKPEMVRDEMVKRANHATKSISIDDIMAA
jgi:hypothetical protein